LFHRKFFRRFDRRKRGDRAVDIAATRRRKLNSGPLRSPPAALLLTLSLASLSPPAGAQEPMAVPAAVEEILVTGQQPGPGLWRVTRPGDARGHVLWVLGNHSPLPRKLVWRSTEIESVVRASQEVLAPPAINASVGPLGGVTLLPSLIGARNNPGKQRLQDVVPPELYARWLPLKARYLGRNRDVERWRPIFAANELYKAALAATGLVPYEGVWPQVEKLARKAHVTIVDPEVELEVKKPRAAIKEFKSMPLDDTECFARTLQRLETELGLMRDRANAWAVGDITRLRQLAPVERATACIGVLLQSSLMQQRGYGDVLDRARLAWLEAAENALARNASTLAVISVDEILRPDGHFSRLRQKGYRVEDPE
jgi:TraB/PrgY/gumN family